MAKLKRAERRVANKARWAMVNAMREAAFRACAGEPPPAGVTSEAWEMLSRAATASADDLRMPGLDDVNAAMIAALDKFQPSTRGAARDQDDDQD
jgi:hypothetical protein